MLDSLGLLVRPDGSNAAAVGLSLWFVLGSLVQIGGIIVSKPLADRFGNKAVFIAGVSVTAIATLLVFFVGPASIGALFALGILWAVGWGPTVPLLWVMIADVADYSEWQTSRRAVGFMYAGILFALKAGLSLGGALSAWVIEAYGYGSATTSAFAAVPQAELDRLQLPSDPEVMLKTTVFTGPMKQNDELAKMFEKVKAGG